MGKEGGGGRRLKDRTKRKNADEETDVEKEEQEREGEGEQECEGEEQPWRKPLATERCNSSGGAESCQRSGEPPTPPSRGDRPSDN